ncbi:MAG: hypothetical protein ABIB72_00470 [Candidatus Falkowbacteria bacterium]
MKGIILAVVVLASMLSGCALLTPPPYMNQTMTIERNADGKVISSKYERSVKGFASHDPGTVINSWAYADNMARLSGSGDYRKAVKEKDLVGVIVNQNPSYTYSVEIISVETKKPVSTALMTPLRTSESWVPAAGDYLDVWKKDGRVVAQGKFTVRDDKIVSYGNYQNLYWYSVKSYP